MVPKSLRHTVFCFLYLEFVPCPVYECKYSSAKIVQQPADLTTLSANLASAAVSFIKHKACECWIVNPFTGIGTDWSLRSCTFNSVKSTNTYSKNSS